MRQRPDPEARVPDEEFDLSLMGTREPQKGSEQRADPCIGKTPLADAGRFQVELLRVVLEDDDNTRT